MVIDKYLKLLSEVDEHASEFRNLVKDCSLIEFRVMDMVDKTPDMRLNDIGFERSVNQQGMGRLAKRLHQRGLVEVVRDARDARVKHIVLTDKGRMVLERSRRMLSQIVAAA